MSQTIDIRIARDAEEGVLVMEGVSDAGRTWMREHLGESRARFATHNELDEINAHRQAALDARLVVSDLSTV